MKRNEIEVEELLRALETIRAEQYPDVPAEIIREIVLAQFEYQDDRSEARRNTVKTLEDYLNNIVVTSE